MYSPKINPKQIRKLYLLKMSYARLGMRKPMTEIVKAALDEHIDRAFKELINSGVTLTIPDEITKK